MLLTDINNNKENTTTHNSVHTTNKDANMSTKLSNLLPTNNNTNKGIVTKADDHGSNLKEKLLNAEMSINKSIYMKTANFLVKHNAFAVII